MDVAALTQKAPEDLQELLVQKRTELATLRVRVAEGQEKNVRKVRTLRRDIAHILTAIHAQTQQA